MKYLIYVTTNNLSGKVYIGCHKTENVNDSYLGSGRILKRAIKKYRIENFSKEIIQVFDNPEDMFSMEAQIVTVDFVKESTNYNLKVGGEGGWGYINDNLDAIFTSERLIERAKRGRAAANTKGAHLKGAKKHQQMLKNDPDYYEWWLRKNEENFNWGFAGRSHTPESKAKIGNANSIRQTGKRNSQYGKCWIYSHTEKRCMLILKEEMKQYIDGGWIKGRKMKF